MSGTGENGSSWEALDIWQLIADITAGIIETPTPDILKRNDGQGLFYRGKTNGVHAESGSGKTWLLLIAAKQEIEAGNNVFYIDYEDSPQSLIMRLLALSVDADSIGRHFHYISPESAFSVGRDVLMEAVRILQPTLIGIDSVGESTAAEGVNGNADDEIATWFSTVAKPLASSGAAVVLLDHVPKSGDSSLWPIGSQRKRAAIDGAQYLQEIVKPFSKHDEGAARLVCAKDRSGNYRVGQRVALLRVIPDGGNVQIEVEVPEEQHGEFKPTVLMDRIRKVLSHTPSPLSFNQLFQATGGKRNNIRLALDTLIADGEITATPGARGAMLHELKSRVPLDGENEPETSSDRYRYLRGVPGTSHITDTGYQSGISGYQSQNVVQMPLQDEATA